MTSSDFRLPYSGIRSGLPVTSSRVGVEVGGSGPVALSFTCLLSRLLRPQRLGGSSGVGDAPPHPLKVPYKLAGLLIYSVESLEILRDCTNTLCTTYAITVLYSALLPIRFG